jgi:dynein heavy chain
VQLLLDDQVVRAQALLGSPAAGPFGDRIAAWVAKLARVQDVLDAWCV